MATSAQTTPNFCHSNPKHRRPPSRLEREQTAATFTRHGAGREDRNRRIRVTVDKLSEQTAATIPTGGSRLIVLHPPSDVTEGETAP